MIDWQSIVRLRFTFMIWVLLVVLVGCTRGREVPNVSDTEAWLYAGAPIGSSKTHVVQFLKTHRIQNFLAESDYKVQPYSGGWGGVEYSQPRVIFAVIAAPPVQRTFFVWCQDEMLIAFDKRLRVTGRTVHQECIN